MREYYTIMIAENANASAMKQLTDKMNEGFYVDNYLSVGRSMLIILQKRQEETLSRPTRNLVREMRDSVEGSSLPTQF